MNQTIKTLAREVILLKYIKGEVKAELKTLKRINKWRDYNPRFESLNRDLEKAKRELRVAILRYLDASAHTEQKNHG